MNVAEVDPPATVTDVGTDAAAVLLDVSVTGIPPEGAGLPSVTVPVEGVPALTDVGFKETPDTTGGAIVRVAVFDAPNVAVIVALVEVATGLVVTVKVVEVAPAGTVTVDGTLAADELELIAIA